MRGTFDKEIKSAIGSKNQMKKPNPFAKGKVKGPVRKPPMQEEVAEGEMAPSAAMMPPRKPMRGGF